jgi:hypothetical protein
LPPLRRDPSLGLHWHGLSGQLNCHKLRENERLIDGF